MKSMKTKEKHDSSYEALTSLNVGTPDELRRLIRFLTGADMICVPHIEVSFFVSTGRFARRLIVHTCGPSVQLPTTYLHYPDFRSE